MGDREAHVQAEIARAFPLEPRPVGLFTLHDPNVLPIQSWSQECSDCQRIQVMLGGQSWIDAVAVIASDDFSFSDDESLVLLQEQAVAYYLPAYLTALASSEWSGWQAVAAEVADYLCPTSTPGGERLKEVVNGYSDHQRRAVGEWLSWMRDTHPVVVPDDWGPRWTLWGQQRQG